MAVQLEPPAVRELVGARSVAVNAQGTQIAFVYRGDIWTAPLAGGRATPVTNNVEMDDFPVWSPDGKWIAFSTNRNGNWDIYGVPAEGGESRRLTWFSGTEIPTSWSPDGREVLYRSTYDKAGNGLYALDVRTLKQREFLIENMPTGNPVLSRDGRTLFYHRKAFFPSDRPRYQGSGASQIWTMDLATGARREMRNSGLQHLWTTLDPTGDGVLTVTATEVTPSSSPINRPIARITDNVNRTPNVYRVGRNGRATRLTNFVGAAVRFLSVTSGGQMVFERDGVVYRMMPGQTPEKITLTANLDPKGAVEERQVLTSGVEGLTLSPDGETIVFTARRELWSVPVKQPGRSPNRSDARQWAAYPGTDSEPVFAPDGKSVFFVSDRDGSMSLYRMDLATGEPKVFISSRYDITGVGFTPDKKRLTYRQLGPNGGLFVVPIEGGTPTRLVDFPASADVAWSPDGRYLAYTRELMNSGFNPWENRVNVFVLDTTNNQHVNVTKLNAFHRNPVFSADGKYLYFTSDRQGSGIYVLPLQPEEARDTELEIKFEKPKETPKVEFDFNRPEDRIRRLWAGNAFSLIADPENGDILFNQGGDIWRVGYDGEGARPLTSGGGIGGFEMSVDKRTLFFSRQGNLNLLALRTPQNPITTVPFRADWRRDVVAERRAAFNEFWRIYNLSFYDANMHGRDWTAIRERYAPLLDSVGHREEMADVLNLMVGELEASHAEVGAAPGGPGSESTAHPGFTIDYRHQGPGLKVLEVPANTPGSFAKTRIKPGEFVLEINGQAVQPDQRLWQLLNGQTGRDIRLLVNSTPSKDGARTVTYRAPSGGAFRQIIFDNRIEWRRQYVEEKSGGRVTYVHIAGMGGGNFAQFNSEVWQYIQNREAVIIDVRENGGGNIADQLLDILERSPQMRYLPRDGQEQNGPGTSWAKPTVVMHAETSFSNAEMFPAAMKARGLASLVGMPTPGYVIYTYGGQLVDGTSIRLPNTGVFRLDGSNTENNGQQPDHRVDTLPEDYFRNVDPQLDKAIEVALGKLRR